MSALYVISTNWTGTLSAFHIQQTELSKDADTGRQVCCLLSSLSGVHNGLLAP